MASAIPGFRDEIGIIVSRILNQGFELKDGKLNLSKIGAIKIILHRDRLKAKSRPVPSKRILTNGMFPFHVKLKIRSLLRSRPKQE